MIRSVDGPNDGHDPNFKWCVGCGVTLWDQPVTHDPSLVEGQVDGNKRGLCEVCNAEYSSVAEKIVEFADSN